MIFMDNSPVYKRACKLYNKKEQQGNDQGIDAGGLRNRLPYKHGPGQQTGLLGIFADGFTSLGGSHTFANTRADGPESHCYSGPEIGGRLDEIYTFDCHWILPENCILVLIKFCRNESIKRQK
jgi:hypothetical protein